MATSCTWMTLLAQGESLVLFSSDNNLKCYGEDLQRIQINNPKMKSKNIFVEVHYFKSPAYSTNLILMTEEGVHSGHNRILRINSHCNCFRNLFNVSQANNFFLRQSCLYE